MSATITRKEIAFANGRSEKTVRNHERAIGLDKCKWGGGSKPIRYDAARAALVLIRAGWLVP